VLSENEIELPGIYIGGGTPSTLNAEQLFMLCDKLIKYPFLTQNFEFTVECGRPDTITDEKLSALKECKVNRISINPQTKNNDVLKEIGRNHTYEDFLKAYELARAYSFDCINTDLIAGLPKDTADGFLESLKAMLDLSPENITVHSFCKKKSADFTISDIHSNEIRLLPEIIKKANDLCINKGYNPYYLYRQKNTAANLENIGYAKDGKLCLYNIAMMQDLCNVFSAGAGAISKIIPKNSLKTLRISHDKYPFEYLKNTEKLKERIIKLNNILRNDDV